MDVWVPQSPESEAVQALTYIVELPPSGGVRRHDGRHLGCTPSTVVGTSARAFLIARILVCTIG